MDYEYPNGVRVMSMCRQMPQGCENNVGSHRRHVAWASQGYRITGYKRGWSFPGAQDNNPYQAEHVALINSIRDGRPINDLKNVTESSLTAIMGRMACYTGQAITGSGVELDAEPDAGTVGLGHAVAGAAGADAGDDAQLRVLVGPSLRRQGRPRWRAGRFAGRPQCSQDSIRMVVMVWRHSSARCGRRADTWR